MIWEPHKRLLTVEEAAATVGRSTGTVWRWVHEGRLQAAASRGSRHYYLEADVLAADAAAATIARNTTKR